MPKSTRDLPLPRGWPRRVRSAVLHVVSLARFAITCARGQAERSLDRRLRLKVENERLRQEISLLQEELRIKDARMRRIPPQRRPHYAPIDRMAILELRAARGWSAVTTAERLLITPLTVASWMGRLDEEGPGALVQTREPVNKFPDFVVYIVRTLKVLCPSMGKVKIAQFLCRIGLHLAATTVGRMMKETSEPPPVEAAAVTVRKVTAHWPNHVWHLDLTTVPIAGGFWTSWPPWAMPQCWPFCWWVAVLVDHYSRRVLGFAVFDTPPSSAEIRQFLGQAVRAVGAMPKYLITDHGTQFTDDEFKEWCSRRGIRQRFGAVGKYGSIAVVERFIRTMKNEGTRRFLVSANLAAFRCELDLLAGWYNGDRPHTALDCATPDEVYHREQPACLKWRFEPRSKWPRGAPCAAPHAPVRGRPGTRLELRVRYRAGRKHLPVVELRRAA